MMKHRLLCLLLAGIFASAAVFAEDRTPAADFTLKTRSGDNLRLAEQKGQVVMLNFWASWCGPCRKEMPLLEAIHNKYQRMGFRLIGMNVDENTAAAERFLQDVDVSFPIAWDSNGAISKLYQVNAMPTTVMIDRDGNVRHVHRGYKAGDEKQYEQLIKSLIRE
ncbi:MAG TPA: TlpA disulfide reductase family protein [Pseudomonadales bacterium]